MSVPVGPSWLRPLQAARIEPRIGGRRPTPLAAARVIITLVAAAPRRAVRRTRVVQNHFEGTIPQPFGPRSRLIALVFSVHCLAVAVWFVFASAVA